MKALITLGVLQTIGIAVLVVHAFREQSPVAAEVHPTSRITTAPASTPSVDEERLRAVIREELTRLHLPSDSPPPAAPLPRDPSADLQRRDAIAQQIEAYRATGTITDAQMQELQADIAGLDEASRKQMLGKLVRALNSGDMKGRL